MDYPLLLVETPLVTPPTLAVKLGLNEAMVLQQLHYRLVHSPLKRDGYTWFNHTYAKWKKQFPFWSEKTISRIFLSLERKGIIVSSQDYNIARTIKTKWYRIDYAVLYQILGSQVGSMYPQECLEYISQHDVNGADELSPSIKEIKKENKKENKKEYNVDLVSEIIHYFNQRAGKSFKANNKSTIRFINGRLKDGYTVEDFKKVIDLKTAQWSSDPKMNSYLRPSTLFNPTNFENYLNETPKTPYQPPRIVQPIVLDYSAGEDE